MKAVLVLLIVACAYLFVSRAEYQAALAKQVIVAQKPICPERDVLGRQLVSSYSARSDVMQIKRCGYARGLI